MARISFPHILVLISIFILPSCAQTRSPTVGREDYPSRQVSDGDSYDDGEFVDAEPDEEENFSFADSENERLGDIRPASFQKKSESSIPPEPLPSNMTADFQPTVMTLTDLERMALENNPTLSQLASVVDKARGIHLQVGLHPNPVIGYSGDEMGNDGASGQQGGFISQTIVTGGKLRLNRAVASQDIQALSWEYQAQRYRVENDVRLRFYEALGAQRRVKLALELQKVAEDGVKTAKQLVEAKQSARPDILQAQVQLNQVLIILQNAQLDYDAAWKQLASVVGQPALAPTRLEGALEKKADKAFTWEGTYQHLLDSSPELQAAYTRAQRARFMIQRQEAQSTPNFLTQFGVAKDNSTGDTITSIQVGIPLPLFNRNQGNIDVARAEYQRAVRNSERLELALRNRLAVVFRNYQKSKQQVERYRKNILPIAKENLKLTDDGYRQGEFDFLRVLTARRTYFETSLSFVQSLTSLRQAEVQISGMLLTGGLNDVRNISPGTVSGGSGLRGQALSGQ